MTGLKGREAAIRDSIEAAARAKADAERTTKELEAKMAEAQRQGAARDWPRRRRMCGEGCGGDSGAGGGGGDGVEGTDAAGRSRGRSSRR